MISSKKIDIAYIKRETPLVISPIRNGDEDSIESIFCNYGKLHDSLYGSINMEKEKEDIFAIEELKPKENREDPKKDNIIPYENKYLVITLSFVFDMYVDNSFKDGIPYGVEKTKFNWKDKSEIIPAVISSNEIRGKSKPSEYSDFLKEKYELCNPKLYDVDLLIYGKGIQYFKGNINYFIKYFSEVDTIGDIDAPPPPDPNYDDEESDDECKPRKEKQRNSLKSLLHINFYGTKS